MKHAKTVDDVIKTPAYPNSPTHVGWLDGLDSPRDIGTYYALRIQSVFIAPQSGQYVFAASCDDKCSVYLSSTDSSADNKEIIALQSWTGYNEWTKYDLKSVSTTH